MSMRSVVAGPIQADQVPNFFKKEKKVPLLHFGCTFKPQAPYSQAPKPFTHQSSHALTIFILF